VVFTGVADFVNATLTDADFRGATFTGYAGFRGATFTDKGAPTTFVGARFQGSVVGASSLLAGLLQRQDALMDFEAAQELPDGWSLEPSVTEPMWGRLVRTARRPPRDEEP
jgi:hypothetical protein